MTTPWTRSLPAVSPETKPFWDGCRERMLIIQRCRACSKYQTYYRAFCCHCWSRDLEDVAAPGTGTVWAFTIAYQNKTPGWEDFVPYVLAAVELDEGVKLMTNILNTPPEKVRIGMPVKVTFVDATDEITIPYFEPA
jgi:uncharacterized OB-fold protein